VSVDKAVELSGTGASIEEAVSEALDRAGMTLDAITSFDVERVSGTVDGNLVTYQVRVKIWFTLLERVHG
jgi:flavin-binding protein dodecin